MTPSAMPNENGERFSLPSLPVQGGSHEKPRSMFSTVVLNFIPSWFAVNMGTGIIAILLHLAPHSSRGLQGLALAFYVLNVLLFLLFTAITAVRHVAFPWVVWRMLNNPTICFFLGCFPMALCTIISGTTLMVVPYTGPWLVVLVQILWWIDVLLTLLSCFAIPILMFNLHDLKLESMTAIWVLPIIPAVVAPGTGAWVAGILPPGRAMVVLVVSYMLWGIGMSLSAIVLVLYFYRLAVHNIPDGEVVVTAFLPLGPCGMGAHGLLLMAQAARDLFAVLPFAGSSAPVGEIVFVASVIGALLLFGIGWWWLLHGLSSVLIRYCQGGVTFSMGFWGFIFPLGVFTAATLDLAATLPSVFLSWLTMVLIAVLVMLWCFVAAGTVLNVANGKLLMGPCMHEGPSNDSDWVTQEAPPV